MTFAARLVALSGILLIALTGCRQQTAVPAARTSAAAVRAPHPIAGGRPVIACFGDSLTAGYGTDPGGSYPDFLQTALDDAGYSYKVVNEGVSGNTTKDGLARVDTVLALHPQIVVVEFGGNDGLRGLPLNDTKTNLDSMVARLTRSGAKVAIAGITLPPDYGADYIRQLTAIYPLLSTRYHAPLLPFLLEGVYGVSGDMQADRTHATAKGNRVVAQNVLRLIQPLLTKLGQHGNRLHHPSFVCDSRSESAFTPARPATLPFFVCHSRRESASLSQRA